MMHAISDIEWNWYSWDTLTIPLLYNILALRQEVFVVEQNCPYLDADGKDEHAFHLIGMHNKHLCCYARVFPPTKEGRIVVGRVIVAQQYRALGYGYSLMNKAHEYSIDRFAPHKTFFLSAQAHLKGFYENLGYTQSGEGYLEDNIPHIPMMRC